MDPVIFLVASFFALFVVNISADNSNKYVVSNQRVTFHDAYVRCRQYELDPAEILSEKDQKEVEKVLQSEKQLGSENGFWIFATNLGDNVSYYWLNSGRRLFYSIFSSGQPDNSGNNENCLEVVQSSIGHFAWNDISCERKLRFICQYKRRSMESCDNNMVASV